MGVIEGTAMAGHDEPTITSAAIDRYEAEAPTGSLAIRSLDDINRISRIFVESGMFKTTKGSDAREQLYQAGVKIIAGVEFGIQPFAAMRGINIINGNAEMSANLMAAKVKKHPKYDYRVKQMDNDGCELTFYEYVDGQKEELGPSSFTMEDARKAGLTSNPTWHKFPKNMCFARALSNGVRIHCPDIFYGAPVYVEGEISDEVETKPAAKAPVTKEAQEAEVVQEVDAAEVVETEVEEAVQEESRDEVAERTGVKPGSLASDLQVGKMHKLFSELDMDGTQRQEFCSQVAEREVQSSTELTRDEARRVLDALADLVKEAAS